MPDDARTGGAAVVRGLHHFTIRCSSAELESLRSFYCDVLGMREGPRPAFDFPGHWLYVGEVGLLHLAAILPPQVGGGAGSSTSGFDHVSLAGARLDATRQLLADRGIPFEELPVPGWPLWQIFLRDPVGSKIELTFDLDRT
jgi:catechol 2,3-dioxygenase-like lactoylglutathione lyase family enzyme